MPRGKPGPPKTGSSLAASRRSAAICEQHFPASRLNSPERKTGSAIADTGASGNGRDEREYYNAPARVPSRANQPTWDPGTRWHAIQTIVALSRDKAPGRTCKMNTIECALEARAAVAPELRTSANGVPWCRLSVAVGRGD